MLRQRRRRQSGGRRSGVMVGTRNLLVPRRRGLKKYDLRYE
jgi:hypothetical protein